MSAAFPSASEIRDYLLRRLPETRRARLEEAYFRDDAVLEQVEQAEDELVSDYVLGRLTVSDRRRFEESLLDSPYYRERVETTTRMRLKLAKNTSFRREPGNGSGALRTGRTGLVVVASLFAILFLASLASALRLKSDLERTVRSLSERRETGGTPLPARTVVLGPGSEVLRVEAPSQGALLLVLPRAVLPEGSRSLRLALNDNGRTAWESPPVSADSPAQGDLSFFLPAGVPPPGLYEADVRIDGEGGSPKAVARLEITPPAR